MTDSLENLRQLAGVDLRIPLLLTVGVLLAFFSWRAASSGVIMLHYRAVSRADQPLFYQVSLILRIVVAVACLAAGCALALGWVPYPPT